MEHIGTIALGKPVEVKVHLFKYAKASKASNHGLIRQLAEEELRKRRDIAKRPFEGRQPLLSISPKKFKAHADVWRMVEERKPPEHEVSHVIATVDGSSFAIVFTPLAKRRQ
jgi:hypothetical protein